MLLNYKTEKLPFSFIALGVLLFVVGIWRIVVLDWKGILLFLVSLIFLFIRSGIQIDSDKKRLKKYTGLFCFRKGSWEDIGSIVNLQILKVREIQKMNVLSISRIDSVEIYKLILVQQDTNIELMMGEKAIILERARKIAVALDTSIIENF